MNRYDGIDGNDDAATLSAWYVFSALGFYPVAGTDMYQLGAPLFENIADDFAAFLEGSIFVAHNVGFDYGFISMEYKRLGRQFRMPKMCTVSSMRKMYPGHKSYSLKNLCREYHIDLTSHHRALCDAKAAAELLFLVNEKRGELANS